MENILPARADDQGTKSGLQSQWQESQRVLVVADSSAAVAAATGSVAGPGPAEASRIDGELKSFATTNQPGADDHMLSFQKIVGDFAGSADKKQAIEKFGHDASVVREETGKEAIGLNEKVRAAIDGDPKEKALEGRFLAQSDRFWKRVGALPEKQNEQVMTMLGWQPGENEKAHETRVSAGLSFNHGLQNSYEHMKNSFHHFDDNKSPQVKAWEAKLNADREDLKVMRQVMEKAAIRADIPF